MMMSTWTTINDKSDDCNCNRRASSSNDKEGSLKVVNEETVLFNSRLLYNNALTAAHKSKSIYDSDWDNAKEMYIKCINECEVALKDCNRNTSNSFYLDCEKLCFFSYKNLSRMYCKECVYIKSASGSHDASIVKINNNSYDLLEKTALEMTLNAIDYMGKDSIDNSILLRCAKLSLECGYFWSCKSFLALISSYKANDDTIVGSPLIHSWYQIYESLTVAYDNIDDTNLQLPHSAAAAAAAAAATDSICHTDNDDSGRKLIRLKRYDVGVDSNDVLLDTCYSNFTSVMHAISTISADECSTQLIPNFADEDLPVIDLAVNSNANDDGTDTDVDMVRSGTTVGDTCIYNELRESHQFPATQIDCDSTDIDNNININTHDNSNNNGNTNTTNNTNSNDDDNNESNRRSTRTRRAALGSSVDNLVGDTIVNSQECSQVMQCLSNPQSVDFINRVFFDGNKSEIYAAPTEVNTVNVRKDYLNDIKSKISCLLGNQTETVAVKETSKSVRSSDDHDDSSSGRCTVNDSKLLLQSLISMNDLLVTCANMYGHNDSTSINDCNSITFNIMTSFISTASVLTTALAGLGRSDTVNIPKSIDFDELKKSLCTSVLNCLYYIVQTVDVHTFVHSLTVDEEVLVAEVIQPLLTVDNSGAAADGLAVTALRSSKMTLVTIFDLIVDKWNGSVTTDSAIACAINNASATNAAIHRIRCLRVLLLNLVPVSYLASMETSIHFPVDFWDQLHCLVHGSVGLELVHLCTWDTIDEDSVKVMKGMHTDFVILKEVQESYHRIKNVNMWLARALPLVLPPSASSQEVFSMLLRSSQCNDNCSISLPSLLLQALSSTNSVNELIIATVRMTDGISIGLDKFMLKHHQFRTWSLQFLSLLPTYFIENDTVAYLMTEQVVLLHYMVWKLLVQAIEQNDSITAEKVFMFYWHIALIGLFDDDMCTSIVMCVVDYHLDRSCCASVTAKLVSTILTSPKADLLLDDHAAMKRIIAYAISDARVNDGYSLLGIYLMQYYAIHRVTDLDDLAHFLMSCHGIVTDNHLYLTDNGHMSLHFIKALQQLVVDASEKDHPDINRSSSSSSSSSSLEEICHIITDVYYYNFRFPVLSSGTMVTKSDSMEKPISTSEELGQVYRFIRYCHDHSMYPKPEIRIALSTMGRFALFKQIMRCKPSAAVAAAVDAVGNKTSPTSAHARRSVSKWMSLIVTYLSKTDTRSHTDSSILFNTLKQDVYSVGSAVTSTNSDTSDCFCTIASTFYFSLFILGGHIDDVTSVPDSEKFAFKACRMIELLLEDLYHNPLRYESWCKLASYLIQLYYMLADTISTVSFMDTVPSQIHSVVFDDLLSSTQSEYTDSNSVGSTLYDGLVDMTPDGFESCYSPLNTNSFTGHGNLKYTYCSAVARKNSVATLASRVFRIVQLFNRFKPCDSSNDSTNCHSDGSRLSNSSSGDLKLCVGTRVSCRWKGESSYYVGRILNRYAVVSNDSVKSDVYRYDILYDDAEIERGVLGHNIKIDTLSTICIDYGLCMYNQSHDHSKGSAKHQQKLMACKRVFQLAHQHDDDDVFIPYMLAKATSQLYHYEHDLLLDCMKLLDASLQRLSRMVADKKTASTKTSMRSSILYLLHSIRIKYLLHHLLHFDELQSITGSAAACAAIINTLDSFREVYQTSKPSLHSLALSNDGYDWETCVWMNAFSSDWQLCLLADLWRHLFYSMYLLEEVRKHEQYDSRSIYRLSETLVSISMLPSSIKDSLYFVKYHHYVTGGGVSLALLKMSNGLFDKKRPQLVAVWCNDVACTDFEKSIQRTNKFDKLRRKYLLSYLKLIELNRGDVTHYIKLLQYLRQTTKVAKGNMFNEWSPNVIVSSIVTSFQQRLLCLDEFTDETLKLAMNVCYTAYTTCRKLMYTSRLNELQCVMTSLVDMYNNDFSATIDNSYPISNGATVSATKTDVSSCELPASSILRTTASSTSSSSSVWKVFESQFQLVVDSCKSSKLKIRKLDRINTSDATKSAFDNNEVDDDDVDDIMDA